MQLTVICIHTMSAGGPSSHVRQRNNLYYKEKDNLQTKTITNVGIEYIQLKANTTTTIIETLLNPSPRKILLRIEIKIHKLRQRS